MAAYIPTLTPEENEKLLQERLKQKQRDLERFGGLFQQQRHLADKGASGIAQNWGMTYKATGREARAEIR